MGFWWLSYPLYFLIYKMGIVRIVSYLMHMHINELASIVAAYGWNSVSIWT